jgi:hypothetical protein
MDIIIYSLETARVIHEAPVATPVEAPAKAA